MATVIIGRFPQFLDLPEQPLNLFICVCLW